MPTNRLTGHSTNGVYYGLLYDAAGNVTNDNVYVYDAESRIVSANGGAAQYAYDHANRRVKKVAAGVTTHYVWQGGRVLAEHRGGDGAWQVVISDN